MTQYLVPSAGTYNCRPVQDTGNLSVHAYGAAIDLATKFGDYWLWAKEEKGGAIPYRNRFPYEIVEISSATASPGVGAGTTTIRSTSSTGPN